MCVLQAEQAGLPVPALGEVNASEQLLDQELSLNILLAEEATDRARDLTRQNSKLAQEQQHKMSENLALAVVSYYQHCKSMVQELA